MILKKVFIFSCVLYVSLGYDLNTKPFPSDFMFGAATASYQVEGGWNEDGKGENVWDRLTHTHPEDIADGSNGDIACDSYHKYKEDVAILRDLGVTHYRFSLSWPRILPDGFTNKINVAGVQYYKDLIQELKDNDIIPLVTMFHWDLPQPIQDLGGYTNELFVKYFGDYARTVFELFGDDVKYWLTFNEPASICNGIYGAGLGAPDILSPGIGEYLCAHNLLKAHALAYHIYDQEFRAKQNGKVSITIATHWYEPATNSTEDEAAAERKLQFTFGWYANPVINGDYPEVMKTRVAKRSKAEGFTQSRLPVFSEEEIEYIKGTYDYLGLNMYSSALVEDIPEPEIGTPSWTNDIGARDYQPEEWEGSASSWLKITPWGLPKLLIWLQKTYNDPDIIITENGFSDDGSSLNDDRRTYYFQQYISRLRDAIDDGVKVFGYTAWSLMDNYEWRQGYTQKFGLYSVDFTDANRTRTPKTSVDFMRKLFTTRCVADSCDE